MKKYHHCVKFTYPLSFQTRIPKVDQHTGGKWLIHGTKHRKDNQLQSLELSCRILDDYFLTYFTDRYVEHFLWNWPQMNAQYCTHNIMIYEKLILILWDVE